MLRCSSALSPPRWQASAVLSAALVRPATIGTLQTAGVRRQAFLSRCASTTASTTPDATLSPAPKELLRDVRPQPVRLEFTQYCMTTQELEQWDIGTGKHRKPRSFPDWLAYKIVKWMRYPTDLFFRKKYLHRVVAVSWQDSLVLGLAAVLADMDGRMLLA